jgi:hypothetical protein
MREHTSEDVTFGQAHRRVTERSVSVAPGAGRSVGMGIYHTSDPLPIYEIILEPDIGESMGVSQEQLTMPSKAEYMLLYHFHNFGDRPCEVTLRQKTPSPVGA